MRTPVTKLIVADAPERLAALRLAERDLLAAAGAEGVEYEEAGALAVTAELGPDPKKA
jgi:hypothetical protein